MPAVLSVTPSIMRSPTTALSSPSTDSSALVSVSDCLITKSLPRTAGSSLEFKSCYLSNSHLINHRTTIKSGRRPID